MTNTIPNNVPAIDTNISSRRRKIILLSCCISFLLLLCPGFMRAISYRNDFWISSTCYFLAVYFLVKKNPDLASAIVRSFVITLAGIALLMLPISKGHIPPGLIIFPFFMLACALAIRVLRTESTINRYMMLSVALAAYVYIAFWGLDLYFTYVFDRYLHGVVF